MVTASAQFFRMVSGTVGVGALGAVLNAHLIGAIGKPSRNFTPNDLLNVEARARLSPTLLALAEHALADGLHRVFLLLSALALVAFVRVMQLTAKSHLLESSREQTLAATETQAVSKTSDARENETSKFAVSQGGE